MHSIDGDDELTRLILEAQAKSRESYSNSKEVEIIAQANPLVPGGMIYYPVTKDEADEYYDGLQGWWDLLGVIRFRISDGDKSIPIGKAFVHILTFLNVPDLTGVDDDYLHNHYYVVEQWETRLPKVEVELFGKPLDAWFPVIGSEKLNAAGKSTTWPRVFLYLALVLLLAVLVLLIGWKFGLAVITMIPGATSVMMSVRASLKEKEYRDHVKTALEQLGIKMDYVIAILEMNLGDILANVRNIMSEVGLRFSIL
jgi:hypothetical protein